MNSFNIILRISHSHYSALEMVGIIMHTQNISNFFRKPQPWYIVLFLLLGFVHDVVQAVTPSLIKKKMICSSASATFDPNQPISIPLNIDSDWGTITDLNVIISSLTTSQFSSFSENNNQIGDLTISLEHGETIVNLLEQPQKYYSTSNYYSSCPGTSITNLKLNDDEPVNNVQSDCYKISDAVPYSSYTDGYSYKANGEMSGFDGDDISGLWTLTVSSSTTSGSSNTQGTISGWCLEYERQYMVEFLTPNNIPSALNSTPKAKVQSQSGAYYGLFSIQNFLGSVDQYTLSRAENLLVEFTITGTDAAAFSLSATTPSLFPIPPTTQGELQNVLIDNGVTENTSQLPPKSLSYYKVKCTPLHLGKHQATLEIRTNDSAQDSPMTYPLNCEGMQAFQSDPSPNFIIQPSIILGAAEVGQSTPLQTLNISEISGLENLNVFGTLGGSSDFFISPNTLTISPKGSGTIEIGCQPTAAGKRTATLLLKFNDPSLNNSARYS